MSISGGGGANLNVGKGHVYIIIGTVVCFHLQSLQLNVHIGGGGANLNVGKGHVYIIGKSALISFSPLQPSIAASSSPPPHIILFCYGINYRIYSIRSRGGGGGFYLLKLIYRPGF